MISPKQAKEIFEENGVSIAEWSRINSVSSQLVYRILSGKNKALRGQSHKIAVLLGIKKGMNKSLNEIQFNSEDNMNI